MILVSHVNQVIPTFKAAKLLRMVYIDQKTGSNLSIYENGIAKENILVLSILAPSFNVF